MNYKLAIVGAPEAIAGFALLGAETVAVQSPEEAIAALFRLKKEKFTDDQGVERNAYAIVFVTEDLMTDISLDDEKKLGKGALPAIIPIPSHQADGGYGQVRLKRIVEQAVGQDILN